MKTPHHHLLTFGRRVGLTLVGLSTALMLALFLGFAGGAFVRGCNAALTVGKAAR